VSREGANTGPEPVRAATPIWVWIVYGLGIFAAVIFAFSILFTVGALYFSDEGGSFFAEISVLGVVLWSLPIVAAVAVWLQRRSR
jgi:hypothetical protein